MTGEKTKDNKLISAQSAFGRVAKYALLRLLTLFITVIIGVYLTILLANMGGYVDELVKNQINDDLALRMAKDPGYREMSNDKRKIHYQKLLELEYERHGLNQPFMLRSFRFLYRAVTLDFGKARQMTSDSGSKQVKLIITERLGPSLLLMGTSNIILFLLAISIALVLSGKYGSRIDKFFISLSPMSSMPSWFYGIFLVLFFAAVLRALPFSGMIDAPPPRTAIAYVWSVLRHLILPAASLTISASFASIYTWRTFFMMYSSEAYVEMARAKGLPNKLIRQRYILRPTLPTVITSFSLMMISMWMGAMVTERVFQWPGLGSVILDAVGHFDTAVIVGATIIYGYLLALTVFLLDFVYALVDPRVKIGRGNRG